MIKVANIKQDEPYTIYIGRANKWLNLSQSKWANIYVMKNESDRARVLIEYENYVRNSPELWNSLEELDGEIVGCYCSPKKCHGDILNKLLSEKKMENILSHSVIL